MEIDQAPAVRASIECHLAFEVGGCPPVVSLSKIVSNPRLLGWLGNQRNWHRLLGDGGGIHDRIMGPSSGGGQKPRNSPDGARGWRGPLESIPSVVADPQEHRDLLVLPAAHYLPA